MLSIFCTTYSGERIAAALGNGDLMLFMQIKYKDCHSFLPDTPKTETEPESMGGKTTAMRADAGQI